LPVDPVPRNAEEPGAKELWVAEGPDIVVHLQKRIVRRIFCEHLVAAQPEAEGEDVSLVSTVELLKGVTAAKSQLINKLFVRQGVQLGAFAVVAGRPDLL
jgi:hypothetical protein